jgi:SARP family transcriptional regulator, regulator of embCAB operon
VVVSPSGTASRLRIRLCGGLAVERGGERLEDRLPSRQARIVFACLVDHRGRPISRAALAEALWGDEPPPSRDVGLRSLLSGVRRLFGPGSVEGRAEVRLELPEEVWIDVEAAGAHLEQAERAFERGEYAVAQLEARSAGDLLQDEFLAGCGGPWVEERRAELEELGRRARELESRAALASGDAAGAERIARRLVERAPYRESAHAALMEALAAQGNVAEAVLAYDRLVRLLRKDLATVPAPAVAALHERLLVEGEHGPPPVRRRRRRRLGPRSFGVGLACAGLLVFVIGLVGGETSDGARTEAAQALPMQEAVLPSQGVAFSHPKGWALRAPVNGLSGAGDGDAFCNIFRVPGAAPPGRPPRGILRYARGQMRAWERSGRGVVAGPVRPIRGAAALGASAVERDRAYAARQAGRLAFFRSGRDVLRIECSAPPASFRSLDRVAFRPLLHSFRTLGG